MTNAAHRPDSDVNIRLLVKLTVSLLVLVAIALVFMWFLAGSFLAKEQAGDPPPPLMMEARAKHEPPGPRLQADPFAELDLKRANEEARLSSYGWVNPPAGVAHIPIDRAMDLMVEHGYGPVGNPEEMANFPTGDGE